MNAGLGFDTAVAAALLDDDWDRSLKLEESHVAQTASTPSPQAPSEAATAASPAHADPHHQDSRLVTAARTAHTHAHAMRTPPTGVSRTTSGVNLAHTHSHDTSPRPSPTMTAKAQPAPPVTSLSASALTAVAAAVREGATSSAGSRSPPPPLRPTTASTSSPPISGTPRQGRATTTTGVATSPSTTPRAPALLSPTSSRYATLARPTPARYQTFLFHGEPHVLDHQTGLVIPSEVFFTEAFVAATVADTNTVTSSAVDAPSPSVLTAPQTSASTQVVQPFAGAPRYRFPVVATGAIRAQPQPVPSAELFLANITEAIHARTLMFLDTSS